MQCKRVGKTAGLEYLDLACQMLTFIHLDYTSWLLDTDEDGPLNVLSIFKGLFPMLTGLEPPFKEGLDWLKFTYTMEWEGGLVAPVFMVLT